MHPIPPKYAERIYNNDKTVFVGKRCLCKASVGNKLIIYESHETKAYTGWATIKYIGKIKTNLVIEKYGRKLMINNKEFDDYSKNRNEMFVIEFENFEKFETPVKPSRFVSISGKYIYEEEYDIIKKNKSF